MEHDVLDVIRNRLSVRHYTSEEVTDQQVSTLLNSAILAPSGGNRQPWFFYVVRDLATRKKLVDAAGGQDFLAEAPVVIVVCADPKRSAERYAQRGATLYCIQDTAAAVQNILLQAASMGLGTCWVGAFDEEAVSAILEIPVHLRPVAMIPVGHAARQPRPRPRRALSEVVKWVT
ncbi:MAG: nitroreductase family protein [Chloroflexi bacterium]|nr:nitroreductase family protein [Chloroflexota bacterium]